MTQTNNPLQALGWYIWEEKDVNGFHRVSLRRSDLSPPDMSQPLSEAAITVLNAGWTFITYSYIAPYTSILIERKIV